MNRNTLLIVALISVIAGAAFMFFSRDAPDVKMEVRETDRIIQSIDETTKRATDRVKSLDRRVKTDVEVIRRETKKHVDSLSPDRVADDLSALLDEWRSEQE